MKNRFFSEYQMLPTRMQGVYKISPTIVRERVNGHPYGEVPHECDQGILCFVDVNASAGLRWEIAAFGKGRVVATLAYGQYPGEGKRLYPEGIPEAKVPIYVAGAMREVARAVWSIEFKNELGEIEKVRGICFDGGWQTETVATICAELSSRGISAAWSKGFPAKGYSRYHHEKAASIDGLKNAEECHLWAGPNGVFLAFNSCYWKEVSQTSYLADPLTPSSSSFWGSSPDIHAQFAQEVCNEVLRTKEETVKYGTVYGWHKEPYAPNHYGDCHAGVLAFGAIRGNFDGIAKAVSAETVTKIAKQRKVFRYVR